LAYAAGLIDGEGTITIRPRKNPLGTTYHYIGISLSNTEPAMVEWLCCFGGSVGLQRPEKANHKALYRWTIDGLAGEGFLRAVEPYLVTKRAQARLALAGRATIRPRGSRLTPELRAERLALLGQMRVLNQRGLEFVA